MESSMLIHLCGFAHLGFHFDPQDNHFDDLLEHPLHVLRLGPLSKAVECTQIGLLLWDDWPSNTIWGSCAGMV